MKPPKQPKTMKLRVTKGNQQEFLGFMRMFEQALEFSGSGETDRDNVMKLLAGAMGEDSIGEFILVPLPPKPEVEMDPAPVGKPAT